MNLSAAASTASRRFPFKCFAWTEEEETSAQAPGDRWTIFIKEEEFVVVWFGVRASDEVEKCCEILRITQRSERTFELAGYDEKLSAGMRLGWSCSGDQTWEIFEKICDEIWSKFSWNFEIRTWTELVWTEKNFNRRLKQKKTDKQFKTDSNVFWTVRIERIFSIQNSNRYLNKKNL